MKQVFAIHSFSFGNQQHWEIGAKLHPLENYLQNVKNLQESQLDIQLLTDGVGDGVTSDTSETLPASIRVPDDVNKRIPISGTNIFGSRKPSIIKKTEIELLFICLLLSHVQ